MTLPANQIFNDDCMHFMPSMPSKSVTVSLTDIPYSECNLPSAGLRVLDKGKANPCDFNLDDFVNELKRITIGSIYIFCGIEQISTLYNALGNDMSRRLCHWEKKNPSPINGQHLWLSATENCVFSRFKNATFNRHCLSNVWNFPSGSSKRHPTEKPLELFMYLILSSSNPGDIIFDPCLGSGTTAAAAIENKRKYIGVEKNVDYFELCKKRIFAHEKGVHADLFSD